MMGKVWIVVLGIIALLVPINLFSEDEILGYENFFEEDTIEDNGLDIGGSISSEFDYNILKASFSDFTLYNPNTAMIYLDRRLKNLVRGFIRGKMIFDPTLTESDFSYSSGLKLSLEELWIKFNIANTLFFTLGKQKIRWGASAFWNPTDTLNTIRRDPFETEDDREGVTILKTHIPLGTANLYAIGLFNDAHNVDEIGYAGRIEVPISTFEFSLSATGAKGCNPIFGFDFSGGIGDIDLYSEFAFFRGDSIPESYKEENKFFLSMSCGISYELEYSSEDTVTFCLEYYYNGKVYSDGEYAYEPYNLSKHYGMFMISIPQPGGWNDLSFMIFNLGNFTDLTFITRPGITITAIQDLIIDFNVGFHYGRAGGELTIGDQLVDISLSFKIAV